MNDLEFSEDGGSIVREDHLLQVVDDDLVASVGAEGSLDGGCNGAAGVDVADDGAIFGIVTEESTVSVDGAVVCYGSGSAYFW